MYPLSRAASKRVLLWNVSCLGIVPALSRPDLSAVCRELRLMLGDVSRPASQRDALAFHLGLLGLRISEVCNLTIRNWNPQRRELWIETLKGGVKRPLPVPAWMVPHLTRWSCWSDVPEDPLLPTQSGCRIDPRNLRRRFRCLTRRVCERAYRFHDLRHTCAKLLMERSGNQLTTVSYVLRHQSLSNTVLYVQSDEDIRQWTSLLDFVDVETDRERRGIARCGNAAGGVEDAVSVGGETSVGSSGESAARSDTGEVGQ